MTTLGPAYLLAVLAAMGACSSTDEIVVSRSVTLSPVAKRLELESPVRAERYFNGVMIKVPPPSMSTTNIGGIGLADGLVAVPEAWAIDREAKSYPLNERANYQVGTELFFALYSRRLPSAGEFVAIALRSEHGFTSPEIRWFAKDPK